MDKLASCHGPPGACIRLEVLRYMDWSEKKFLASLGLSVVVVDLFGLAGAGNESPWQ